MEDAITETRIKTLIDLFSKNERLKRIYLAIEAEGLGWGGMSYVSKIAGVDKNTLTAGKMDLEKLRKGENSSETETEEKSESDDISADMDRIRAKGGGRKSVKVTYPGIVEELQKLVDGNVYGNPENPLSYTSKSTRHLAEELSQKGFKVSHSTVKELLEELGYSLQGNRKLKQVGNDHEDRDEQFRHINQTSLSYMAAGEPVISIDCKKKENLGEFAYKGVEYRKFKNPVAVLDHDFYNPENGKAIPYGTYDIGNNEGYVSVGISHDTASFAVNSIYSWWTAMGRERYPNAKKLYITADGGGSNGSRNRLWKTELQAFADKTKLEIEVSHFPPGTSKWNKIEHRLFSFISKNWRGRPLENLQTVVNLIASTTTSKGLRVACGVDLKEYETGIKVTDEELSMVNLFKNEFHGEWNYRILPKG